MIFKDQDTVLLARATETVNGLSMKEMNEEWKNYDNPSLGANANDQTALLTPNSPTSPVLPSTKLMELENIRSQVQKLKVISPSHQQMDKSLLNDSGDMSFENGELMDL